MILLGWEMFLFDGNLTGLLSNGGGLALAILRHGNHTDVIIDTRLQPIDGVMASCRQDDVLKDGYALACSQHGDPVTGDGCGVDWWPAETDGGVTHILEREVRQLGDIWLCGEEIGGEQAKRDTENKENNKTNE